MRGKIPSHSYPHGSDLHKICANRPRFGHLLTNTRCLGARCAGAALLPLKKPPSEDNFDERPRRKCEKGRSGAANNMPARQTRQAKERPRRLGIKEQPKNIKPISKLVAR